MIDLKTKAKALIHRCWPILAYVGIFAAAQVAARVIPHPCTF